MKDNNQEVKKSSNAAANQVVQKKSTAKSLSSAPVKQLKENNTGLPDNLKSGVENLSGHSMDDVKVHYNSAQPAQLNAHAYAQGSEIHVAPGQDQHLPHEAWHVAQQKQGRVQPTAQMKSKNVNDDSNLEKEADTMGHKALNSTQQSFTSGPPSAINSMGNSAVVQRQEDEEIPEAPAYPVSSLPKDGDHMQPDGSRRSIGPRSLTPEEVHARMADNPDAGDLLRETGANKAHGENTLSTWGKIKKKTGQAWAGAKEGVSNIKKDGGGSFFGGLWSRGKAAMGSAKNYMSEKYSSAKESVKSTYSSFEEKSGMDRLKMIGGGITKLATGKSAGDIKGEYSGAKGFGGKALAVGKTFGRLINRLSFGTIGGLAKGAYKLGTGIGAIVTGNQARNKANAGDELSKTYGSSLAKSQMAEGGLKAGSGAFDIASKGLKLGGQPLASSIVGGVGSAVTGIGKLAIGEGAKTGVDYLSQGPMSMQEELSRGRGYGSRIEAVRHKRAADRTGDGSEANTLMGEADAAEQKAKDHAMDVQEGRATLKPSDIRKQAEMIRAKQALQNSLEGSGTMKGLKRTQDLVSDTY